MPCNHLYAQYPVDPRTGKRLDSRGMAMFGVYFNLRSFCMKCGEPKPEPPGPSVEDQP